MIMNTFHRGLSTFLGQRNHFNVALLCTFVRRQRKETK